MEVKNMIIANEKSIASSIMWWAMKQGGYQLVLPNSNTVLNWEADILAVSKSMLLCEYEIKISKSDYKKDFTKIKKHNSLQGLSPLWHRPSYFTYVTHGFDIEPPTYAGWIRTDLVESDWGTEIKTTFKKRSPRLHSMRVDNETINFMARLISFRLSSIAHEAYPFYERKKDNEK